MHVEAYRWLDLTLRHLPRPSSVLELGSRDINGTPRTLLAGVPYVGIDLVNGPGVDIVADAAMYAPETLADVVLCCEVLEHAEEAPGIVFNAVACAKPGGHVLITCATDPRAPHSAVDGGGLRDGEWYRNIQPEDLIDWVRAAGAMPLTTELSAARGDLYLLAKVPE